MNPTEKIGADTTFASRYIKFAWLPIPVFIVIIAALWAADIREAYESPYLLTALSIVFSTLVYFGAAYLIGRAFLIRGLPGLLVLGCGLLGRGIAGTVGITLSGVAGQSLANDIIAILNLCIWLSALCQMAGVILIFRSAWTVRRPGLWLAAAYAATFGAVGLFAVSALTQGTQVFFIQGQGGTPVRQLVLGSAVAILMFTAILLRAAVKSRTAPAFVYWYFLGLVLSAVGLFGVLLEPAHGCPLGWAGRSAQFLGGAYIFISAVAAMRETRVWERRMDSVLSAVRLRYSMSVIFVLIAAIIRLVFLRELGAGAPYVTFYPAAMLAALYGGFSAGLLAASISSLLVSYFWIEPFGQLAIQNRTDLLGLVVFFVSSAMVSGIAEAMHRAQARARNAEAEVKIAAERRRAEKVLKEREEQLRLFVEHAPAAIAMFDTGMRYLAVSRRWLDDYGLSGQDILGRSHYEIFPEISERWKEIHRRCLAGAVERAEVDPFERADGSIQWLKWEIHPWLSAAGGIGGIIMFTEDITGRKLAEEELKKYRVSLEELVLERTAELERVNQDLSMQIDVMPIAHIVWDADTRVSAWNPAAEKIFGYKAGEAIGKLPSFFLPEESRPHVDNITDRLRAGEFAHSVNQNLTKDGRIITCEWHNTPLKDEDGNVTGILSMVQDLTEKKHAEEEAMKMQRLDSLRVMAGGIVHDLNNMMVAVAANAGLALKVIGPDSPAVEFIEGAQKAIAKVSNLTNKIRNYTGKTSAAKEPVALNEVVNDSAHLLMASISKNASLEISLGEGIPIIEADPQGIQQVVTNLIVNASDALGESKGAIRVSTGKISAGRSYLDRLHRERELPEGEYAYIEVSDTGAGMSRETQRKIFEPFFSTKFTGRGLGLSSSYGIVDAHGGAIELESEEGRGTRFRVLLPVSANAVKPREEKVISDDVWSGKGTILLVDDEEDVLKMTKRVLETAGYSVLTAADGLEAVEVFRENADSISVSVIDLIMPYMRGNEASLEIRKIREQASIILQSGYHDLELGDLMKGPGRTALLEKPCRPVDLLKAVQEILKP
ncbi:MAG TPA: PAS domain S-box protein [Nitrospirota bacterium]